jgi:hypothetical protein
LGVGVFCDAKYTSLYVHLDYSADIHDITNVM